MMTKQPHVTWGQDGWAETDGWASAHCANPATHEYQGEIEVWVSAGTGLPACAFLDAPPASEPGKAIIRHGDTWQLVADYRGQTVYDKQTKSASVISELGELLATQTLIAPSSQFDAWDEQREEWVKDDAAEQKWLTTQATQQKAALMTEAASMTATLQDAVDLGMATPEEEAALLDWKRYRVTLSRIDVAVHPVTWPSKP